MGPSLDHCAFYGERRLRYLLLASTLLLTNAAFASDQPASCEIAKSSILGLSSAGLPQVSNLGMIEVTCRVAARPSPDKPGEVRYGLRAATTAYQIYADGTRNEVPSEVNLYGGGEDREREWISFYFDLPLEPAERDLEARRYLDRLQKKAPGLISDSDMGWKPPLSLSLNTVPVVFGLNAAFLTGLASWGSVSLNWKCSSRAVFPTPTAFRVIGKRRLQRQNHDSSCSQET